KEVSQFTDDNVARVKAFHPLAENQVWEFYINEQDEIIDDELMERKKHRLSKRLSYVTPFKKALALATKKAVDEKEKSSTEAFTLQAEAFVSELVQPDTAKEDNIQDVVTQSSQEIENNEDENEE